jgi:hypothetical protein
MESNLTPTLNSLNFSLKGEVEIIHTNKLGELIARYLNHNLIVRAGEDFLVKFFNRLASGKYDANEGSTQAGYMDAMSIGTGFKSDAATAGNTTTLVLPYAPAGFIGDNTWLDGATVKIYTGANAGETKVVATSGFTLANASFSNKPTITVTVAFSAVCAVGIQFSITPKDRETALQGEATADGDGVTITTATNHRKIVTSKTVQTSINEIILSAQWASTPLTGGTSIRLVEAGLHNHATNGNGTTASGNMFARVVFPEINKAADDTVTLNWKFIFGTTR